MRLIILISAGAFIFCSAFIMKSTNEKNQTPLFETKWSLKKIYSTEKDHKINNNAFFILNKEKQSAGGNGGCNSFGSNFIIDKKTINIENIISTKMYCDGIQPMEDLFLKQLKEINNFEIKGNKLFLFQDKKLLLEFISK